MKRKLEQHKERYQQQQSETELGLRDFLPSICETFMSKRERLSRAIDQINESLNSIEVATEKLEALEELRTLCAKHEEIAQKKLRQELEGVKDDIDHYLAEEHRLQEERISLDEKIDTVRLSLSQPDNTSSIRYLPIRYDKLPDITQIEHSEELTSIRAYLERGLIDGGKETIHELVRECYRESRDWSPSVSRHNHSISRGSVHESSFVFYQEENESLVKDLLIEFTEPDTIWSSSDQSTCSIKDQFRIEIVSLSHGGKPHSLEGFRTLTEWEKQGHLQALATTNYKNPDQAIAYPEWYDEIEDEF